MNERKFKVIKNKQKNGCRIVNEAEIIFEKYRKWQNDHIYTTMIKLYGNALLLDKAMNLFEEMLQSNNRISITIATVCNVISACIQSKQFDKALELFEKYFIDTSHNGNVSNNSDGNIQQNTLKFSLIDPTAAKLYLLLHFELLKHACETNHNQSKDFYYNLITKKISKLFVNQTHTNYGKLMLQTELLYHSKNICNVFDKYKLFLENGICFSTLINYHSELANEPTKIIDLHGINANIVSFIFAYLFKNEKSFFYNQKKIYCLIGANSHGRGKLKEIVCNELTKHGIEYTPHKSDKAIIELNKQHILTHLSKC